MKEQTQPPAEGLPLGDQPEVDGKEAEVVEEVVADNGPDDGQQLPAEVGACAVFIFKRKSLEGIISVSIGGNSSAV